MWGRYPFASCCGGRWAVPGQLINLLAPPRGLIDVAWEHLELMRLISEHSNNESTRTFYSSLLQGLQDKGNAILNKRNISNNESNSNTNNENSDGNAAGE